MLAGCQSSQKVNEGGTPAPQIRKIISLSPSTTEIAAEEGLTPFIVGRTASCDFPKEVRSAVVVVENTKPDFEKIAKIKPDIIIYDESLYASSDMEKLKETGAKIITMNPAKIDGITDFMLDLGGYCGVATRASELADNLYGARDRAKGAAPTRRIKVSVLMPGTGEYLAAGQETFVAEVVRICGGEVVGPTGKLYAPISIESLIQSDPDMIIVAGDGHQVLVDSRLSSIKALKSTKKRVYEIQQDYVFRPGPKTVGLFDVISTKINTIASETP